MLLTTGSGLYGIGLYGTGPEAEIRLEGHTAKNRYSVPATGPDGAGDPSSMRQLTRTFVNPDALRSGDRSPRRRSPEPAEFGGGARSNSYDEPGDTTFGGTGDVLRSAAVGSTPTPLGSRNTLGYSNSLADAAAVASRRRDYSPPGGHLRRGDRYAEEADKQWGGDARGGRGRSRSRSRRRGRSLSGNRRGRTTSGSNWGEGAGGRGRRNGRRSSSPDDRRFSHTGRRGVSPHRRQSPQRRGGSSPSPRSRGPRRRNPSTKRSLSRSPRRKGSPPSRGSPRRRSTPPRRGVSPRKRGRSPRHSPQRRAAERARSHRSRDDANGLSPEMRRRHGTVRPAAGRDGRPPPGMASSRKAAGKQSAGGAKDEDPTMGRGNDARQESYRGRRGDDGVIPPLGYGSGSPPVSYVAPAGYNTEGSFGAPIKGRRELENGRDAVGVGAAGMIDPIIPLALGGAPIPPVAAAVPGKRLLVESAVGGVTGLPTSDDPSRKRYHAQAGNGEHLMGQSAMPGGNWQGRDGGGNGQGGGRGPPVTPYPVSAKLPPPSSLRPLPLPAGRAQGVRLMIKGTHPAVPERRIHAVVSAFGVVGKIEVLEVRNCVLSVSSCVFLSFGLLM